MATSFSGGGSESTRRKPLTMGKQLVNFITCDCKSSAPLGNRFHAQYILPRALNKIIDDHVATVYEAYQADIDLSLEDFRREVARSKTSF
jgi:hypothetical protein